MLFLDINKRGFSIVALTTSRWVLHTKKNYQRPLGNFAALHLLYSLRNLQNQTMALSSSGFAHTGSLSKIKEALKAILSQQTGSLPISPLKLWQWLSLTLCLLGGESGKIEFIKFCHQKSSVFFQKTKPIPSIQRSGKHLWVSGTVKRTMHAAAFNHSRLSIKAISCTNTVESACI